MGRLNRCRSVLAVAVAVVVLASCGRSDARTEVRALEVADATPAHTFDVERIVTGLDRPTFAGAAPGDPRALWVLEQAGRVVRLEGDRRDVVLDLSAQVGVHAEAGLLGMAFHPNFAVNHRLFLHWTDRSGDTRVQEFAAASDRRVVLPEPVRALLFVDQPEENHNGGQLAFGPDGRLYLGLGDGGGAFDSHRTAQDPRSLLGKVVAADVDAAEPRWRVVVSGLRNPWRFSFDPALGELWIADVGQDEMEEVNRVPLELDEPPKNLGWSVYEGTKKVRKRKLDRSGELVPPVATYTHDEGCSVVGGFVYGGARFPRLGRRYVYGDFCSGALWTLRALPGKGAADLRSERAKVPQLTHIGADGDGEIVLVSLTGSLYRAVPPAP